jgi:hypothetical protein
VASAHLPLAILGAVGLGIALGTGARLGIAHVGDAHLGGYTFSSSDCSDDGVDPINIVFKGGDANTESVRDHAARSDHGGWDDHSGSQQYFYDHGFCEPKDDQSADGGGTSTRFHMRYNEADVAGALEFQPGYGYHVAAAAHHEDLVFPGCGLPPWHAVDGNESEPPGGFNMARDEIYRKWLDHAEDPHSLTELQDWQNVARKLQCDGEYAWSSGHVFVISMPVYGGGGGCAGRAFCF